MQKDDTGAVRSSDGEHLDFTSLPWVGIMAVARTSRVGGKRYGRFNYMKGFPAWKLVNRSMRHIALWILGDRSSANLEHAAWGLLDAIQELQLNPEANKASLLGPGATLQPEMLAEMDAQAAALAAFRNSPESDELEKRELETLPEVKMLLEQRKPPETASVARPFGFTESFWDYRERP